MLSQKEVQIIAKLAKLELTQKEVANMQKDLSAVLDYFKNLQEVNTTDIKPTFQPQNLINITRQDKPSPQEKTTIKKMLQQAPTKQGNQIKVKGVL